jgi:glycogen debranching enzyme
MTSEAKARAPETTTEFYISTSTSLVEQHTETLKQGDAFAVVDNYGDILPGDGAPMGLFYCDTRHLSRLELLVNGRRPLLLSYEQPSGDVVLSSDLTNPDYLAPDGSVALCRASVHILRSKFLWDGACRERILVRSYDSAVRTVSIELRFAADFADLFEVRGHHRPRRGRFPPATVGETSALLRYVGLDGVERSTEIAFDQRPSRLDSGVAEFDLELGPGRQAVLFLTVSCRSEVPAEAERDGYFGFLNRARHARAAQLERGASVQSSNALLNEMLTRATNDAAMLTTDTEQGPYPYAGTPWFSTAFGRDGIITALFMLWLNPTLARGVLRFLAANQATETDAAADAEPGKILHETRGGEMAMLGEVPFRRYYGSVDATPLFIVLAGAYFDRTGDVALMQELWPNVKAALAWIDGDGDRDGDGFVEYGRQADTGLINQGWKDSHDSVFHADGSLCQGPIALSEVQAYVYAAKEAAARIAAWIEPKAAPKLLAQAAALRRRYHEAFWCEDLGLHALALDGAKRPARVRASNAGHGLFAGIVEQEQAARAAEVYLGEDFFSGWGVRTVAAGEARYSPMSYHNGSIWPHDTALIALGLGRYGLKDAAVQLFRGLFDASIYLEHRRLPELFCGFDRRPRTGPTRYPVACSPQAWAAAAPFALIGACLSPQFDAKARDIRFVHPQLPDFVDELRVKGLVLNDAKVDLRLRRIGRGVVVDVLDRHGDVRVVTIA